MAPQPFYSPRVELHESEIVKPQPLRIIKRSKTISGSTASGETLCGGRGPSGSSEQSRGSPPIGINRPLTVRKLRKGRSSVMNGSFDAPTEQITGSGISELIKKQNELKDLEDDPDLTPKARRQVPRTMSAGAFLKTELHRGHNDGRFSVRGTRSSVASSDIDLKQQLPETLRNPDGSPKIPQRRLSKSKNFLLRAIGGRSSPDKDKPKNLRKISTASKSTLIRRISRGKSRASTPWGPNGSESECSSTHSSFKPGSMDIADMSIHSSPSSSYGQANISPVLDTVPLVLSHSVALLCPQITITPEVSSVDAGNCTLWVAIEVSGTLRNVEKNQTFELPNAPSEPMNSQLSGTWRYGYLHSMRIDLLPARNCFITDLVGDLHDANPIRAGETRLILARISLSKSMSHSRIRESSSDELIADLESDLGNTLAPYLDVRVTYKHSGFLDYEYPFLTSDGMTSHTTQLQTDAKAIIRRHNSSSAWSPRTSQALNSPPTDNPLVQLVHLHLDPELAEEVVKRLAEERPIPKARRPARADGSSEETVKPFTAVISPIANSTVSTSLINAAVPKCGKTSHLAHGTETGRPFARLPSLAKTTDEVETDPARKIWSEMRRSSRSRHIRPRHGRNSLSADHFYSMEEDSQLRNPSSGANSSIDSTHSAGSAPATTNDSVWDIERQRNHIREIALKNKRSMGAETLRSIAPSVERSLGKGKGGTIGGLGLGVGRSWGWGPPWW